MIQFANLIREHLGDWTPKTIFEIGACDCADSIRLADSFPEAIIYSFEANPKTIPIAQNNAKQRVNITFVPMAVSWQYGNTSFYQSKTDNQGTSSLFKSSGKYDVIEPLPQQLITVPCIRLDSFMDSNNIKAADALWLDAQGSELMILEGLGEKISTVRAVWTEFEYDEIYEGQPLIDALIRFMESNGLHFYWKQDVVKDKTGKWWWGDAFFARK